jgi:hypothetical protein
MLLASVLAGLFWEAVGSAATFHAGAALCGVALVLLSARRLQVSAPSAEPRSD